jgi:hypothetical protein|tara:strand:+ start:264 stop:644 length:381 start_codon:yes stop_codon:yes gene_type:complete
MKIAAVEHNLVYKHFARAMKSESVAIQKIDTKTKYLGLFLDGELIGVTGWQNIGEKHIRYKTSYVIPRFRKMGFYKHLWISRENLTLQQNPEVISAYCTRMSIGQFLKNGFKTERKQEISYLKKHL